MANIDEIRVTFSAPERFLEQLNSGATVTVSSPAFPGHNLAGQIAVIEPMIDAATRSARIVARVQNLGRRFRPGMSANVSAVLSERTNALTIPNEAVFREWEPDLCLCCESRQHGGPHRADAWNAVAGYRGSARGPQARHAGREGGSSETL